MGTGGGVAGLGWVGLCKMHAESTLAKHNTIDRIRVVWGKLVGLALQIGQPQPQARFEEALDLKIQGLGQARAHHPPDDAE